MLLGVDVAGILNGVLGKDAKAATLVKIAPGARTPGAISSGTNPTSTSYTCRGWIETYDERDIDGTLITQQDRKISLLGRSLAVGIVPAQGDKITIVDLDGVSKTFRIQGDVLGSGPQGALFICQGRQ